MNTKAIISRTFIALLALSLVGTACKLAPPTRVSNAAARDTSHIKDPVKYREAQEMVNRANKLYVRKREKEALKLARESIEVHETFEGYYLIGTILYQQNKVEDSRDAYLKAEKLNSTDQQLLLTIGTVYTALGDLNAAQERYLRLHATYPDDPTYAYKVGTTYKNLRDYDKAYEYLKKAEVDDFEYLDQVYLQLGDVALELKRYDESEAYFAKAKARNPKLRDAAKGGQATQVARKLEEGNAAFREKKYDEALKHFNEAKRLAPQQSAPYLLAGSTLLVTEDYDEARANLLKAVEYNPGDPKGYSLLGSAYHKQKNYRSALQTFERGLEVAPESFEILNKTGLVYRDREENRKAIDAFSRAVRLKPDFVPARVNLAFALLDDKRYVDARREFEEAQKYDPNDPELKKGAQLVEIYTLLDRGDRFFKDRRFVQALGEYERALQIRDDVPLVHNSIGRTQIERKQYTEAEAAYQKSLSLDENNVPALQGLLRVYSLRGLKAKEKETLARLQKLTNNDITAAITVGRIKEDSGDLAGAEKYYLDLMKQYPEETAVKRRLGYVYYKQALEQNERERFKPALALFEKAEKYNPEIPQLPETLKVVRENVEYAALLPKLKRAEALFARGRHREALPLFEQVYAKLPRAPILVKIANCHISLGNDQKGIALLEQAEKDSAGVDVEISEAIYNYLLQKGEVDRAEQGFRKIVNTNPDAYYSWYKLGIIDLMRKKPDAAVEKFNRSVIYKPDFAVGYIARGVALYGKGERKRAQLEFEEALKRDREAVLASFNIGVLYYNEEMLGKAKEIFQDLVKEFPDFCDARYQLSYIYFREDALEEAEREIRACMKDRDDARDHWALAQIYEKKFQKSRNPQDGEALRSVYRDIIARFPSSKYAADSRRKMLTVAPDTRIVQPYPLSGAAAKQDPILYNGDLILIEDKRIVAFDSAAKKKRYEIKTAKRARGLMADDVLHVLADGMVAIYDTHDGSLLTSFPAPAGATAITGAYNRIGITVSTKQSSELRVYDRRGRVRGRFAGETGSRFHGFGENFYRLDRKGNSAVVRLLPALNEKAATADAVEVSKAFTGELAVPFGRLRSVPNVSDDGERLYLFQPGDRVVVLSATDAGVELSGTIKVGSGTATFEVGGGDAGPRILIPSANQVSVYDASGKIVATVKLPVAMLSQYSLKALPGEKFLYVSRDRQLRQLDYQGKELWKLAIPTKAPEASRSSSVEEAFSIYY